MRLKVVKSKILDKGPVPKKGQRRLQYLLTWILMVRGMVTEYLVIKYVIHTKTFISNTISAHFKQELFLSWAIDRNHIKHDLLWSLSNFVVYCFSFQKSEFLRSHSLDCYYMYNLLTIEGYKFFLEERGRDCYKNFLCWPFYNWRLPKGYSSYLVT